MHRRLRTWRLLPPRNARGAFSMTMTRAPRSAATSAAHKAALPPPSTATSKMSALNAQSVLDADDAGNAAHDVLGLPTFHFRVDDAGEQDARVPDDDVNGRNGL